MTLSDDERYMLRCLQLARLGAGSVSPNPMVGAILVHDDVIIGEGYHELYGEFHAEVNCINSVGQKNKHLIKNSTLYVSLEPCSHRGKTPPCVDFILQHEIKKVVTGCRDISAKVNGKGIEYLKSHDIEVSENILQKECEELNKRFFCFEKNKRPYIILKWAETADGFIGELNERIKISNEFTNRVNHQWRANEDAILVGYNTALTDNPELNVRLAVGKNPVRIVYDKNLSLPVHLHIFNQQTSTIIFNHKENKTIEKTEFVKVKQENFIEELLHELYKRNIQSLIVEGGKNLLQKFIDIKFWDEARIIKSEDCLHDGILSPSLSNAKLHDKHTIGDNTIFYFQKTSL